MIQTTTLGVDGRTITEYLGVAIGTSYETVGRGASMLMVTVSGTALRLSA